METNTHEAAAPTLLVPDPSSTTDVQWRITLDALYNLNWTQRKEALRNAGKACSGTKAQMLTALIEHYKIPTRIQQAQKAIPSMTEEHKLQVVNDILSYSKIQLQAKCSEHKKGKHGNKHALGKRLAECMHVLAEYNRVVAAPSIPSIGGTALAPMEQVHEVVTTPQDNNFVSDVRRLAESMHVLAEFNTVVAAPQIPSIGGTDLAPMEQVHKVVTTPQANDFVSDVRDRELGDPSSVVCLTPTHAGTQRSASSDEGASAGELDTLERFNYFYWKKRDDDVKVEISNLNTRMCEDGNTKRKSSHMATSPSNSKDELFCGPCNDSPPTYSSHMAKFPKLQRDTIICDDDNNSLTAKNSDIQLSLPRLPTIPSQPKFSVQQYFISFLDGIETIFFSAHIEEELLVLGITITVFKKKGNPRQFLVHTVDKPSKAYAIGMRVGDRLWAPNLPIGIWDPQCKEEQQRLQYGDIVAHFTKRPLHFVYSRPLHPTHNESDKETTPVPVAATNPTTLPVDPIPAAKPTPTRNSPPTMLPSSNKGSTVKFADLYPNFMPNLDLDRSAKYDAHRGELSYTTPRINRSNTVTQTHSGNAPLGLPYAQGTRTSSRQLLSLSQGSSVDSSCPSTSNSIRNNAKIATVSTGKQDSASSCYRLDYHPSRVNDSQDSYDYDGDENEYSQLHQVTTMHQQSPQAQLLKPAAKQHSSNQHAVLMDKEMVRVCYCDNLNMPKDCKECEKTYFKVACPAHRLLPCSNQPRCNKMFHTNCIAQYQRTTMDAIDPYYCMECTTAVTEVDLPYNADTSVATHPARLRNTRLGLGHSTVTHINRKLNYARTTLEKQLTEHAPREVQDAIFNNQPHEFPSAVNMLQESVDRHVLQGRRFEVAMQLFAVDQCTCCGLVQPGLVDKMGHVDTSHNRAPKAPFERKALTNVYKGGWHCTCMGFCNGSQFYANTKGHLDMYRQKHGGRSPWEVLAVEDKETNAMLCDKCYDVPKTDLTLRRKFSLINGFGPCHVPPPVSPDEHPSVTASRELHLLLKSFTAAEEAAIRQIAPLISITKLQHGNIGMKGNTSCAQVKSTWNRVLPNLPAECKIIILRRSNKPGNGLTSTRFRRDRIQRVLELLKATGHPAWQIDICEDRLSQWPVEGDLTDPSLGVSFLVENDDDSQEENSQDSDDEVLDPFAKLIAHPCQGNNDLGDEGPAPLQFADNAEEETYDGLMCLADANGALGAQTGIIDDVVRKQVEKIAHTVRGVLPDIPVEIVGNTAILPQNYVTPVDGFVNMNQEAWAYAKAFPTLFIPWYGHLGGNATEGFISEGWHITHDYKGWHRVRDHKVILSDWMHYETWRSDGMFSKHPTAALVVYNQKAKNSCNSQGSACFKIHNKFDPTMSIEAIKNATADADYRKEVDRVIEQAHIHTSSVVNTPKYWQKIFNKFEGITFWQSYIHQRELTMFHTGSLAEYHDFNLRILLWKYKMALSGTDSDDCDLILTDDAAFARASNDYKHVCSHFLATKMEMWFLHYMKPVYEVTEANVSFEFAKSRGVIHYHSPSFTEGPITDAITDVMSRTALAVSDAQDVINGAIDTQYDLMLHDKAKFEFNPSTINNHQGMDYRASFVFDAKNKVLTKQWDDYKEAIDNALITCAKDIEPIVEGHYGMSAMHTGNFPEDWVKPGTNPAASQDYRETCEDMQSSREVVDRRELKTPKFMNESRLFERSANLQNHHLTHKCSDYCARIKKMTRKYDEIKDKDIPETDCYRDKLGVKRVRYLIRTCRFYFGEFLEFDPSGENNLTRGKERIDVPSVEQVNGIMRYFGRRNHPRLVQGVHGSVFYGANADFQIALHNGSGPKTLAEKGAEWYEKFVENLSAAGLSGLEHWNASHCLNRYATGYSCKGNNNPQDWKRTREQLTSEYLKDPANTNKSFRNLIGKHMNEITRGMNIPKDQALYCNSGGVMERSTTSNVLSMSVNYMKVAEFGAAEINRHRGEDGMEAPDFNNSFTWPNVMKRYSNRPQELLHLNLYKFITHHWKQNAHVCPIFYGYQKNASSWPLTEEFCKYTLAIYKPWQTFIEENRDLEDGTYFTTLKESMWDTDFPGSVRADILRVKRAERWKIDSSDLPLWEADGTPSDERQNEANTVAADVATCALVDQSEAPGDLGQPNDDIEYRFRTMNHRAADHDWSVNYNTIASTALETYKDDYYKKAVRNSLKVTTGEVVQLFQEETNRPEKARTDGQRLIIYHYLLCLKELIEYEETEDKSNLTRPPDQRVLVEGLPGTGKSWVIKTMRNIVRQLYGTNTADIASTPTGSSAALINGMTHYRAASITPGKHFKDTPTNMGETNKNKILDARIRMSSVKSWLMDEHSMAGTEMFAWLCHRAKELRTPQTVMPNETESDSEDVLYGCYGDLPPMDPRCILEPEVYNRTFGGIPIIHSIGDSFQLPPVFQRAFYYIDYSGKDAPPCGSDLIGRLVVSEFRYPTTDDEESNVFVLDHVVRQDDKVYLDFLTRLRLGQLNQQDVDFLASRCMENLSPEEQKTFENAIHIVPQWKLGNDITYQYLDTDFDTPIAILQSVKRSKKPNNNCFNKSTSTMPSISAICVGAKVMLQINYVVENKLMNGSIGTVVDICYKNRKGPYDDSGTDDSEYVVVDFPDSTLPVSLIPGKPKTWVPIPVNIVNCEHYCCSCKTIPIRVCKACSVHKMQGVTVGHDQQFTHCVCYLSNPSENTASTPGMEVVLLSRAKNITDMAIGNKMSDLSSSHILKIGTTASYDQRKMFFAQIARQAKATKARVMKKVALLDTRVHNKTYDGGCAELLKWYRDRVGDKMLDIQLDDID